MDPDAPLLTREIFGNVSPLSKGLFYLFSLVAMGVFAWGVVRRARLWRRGRGRLFTVTLGEGLRNLWRFALLQRRVRGRGAASVSHFLLSGGFIVLAIGTALIAVEHGLAGLLGRPATDPVFHKGVYYAVYEVVMDAAGVALIVGCLFFVYRHRGGKSSAAGSAFDWLVLGLLLVIAATGYVLEALRILHESTPMPGFSFVGASLAAALEGAGLGREAARGWHVGLWWFHAVIALALTAMFPYTRLVHGIAGSVRLASGVGPQGRLSPLSMEEVEETGEIGVSRIDQFSRQQLVELDACVSCGRCEDACPAHEAGKPLSPRDVVQDLRAQLSALPASSAGGGTRPGDGDGDGDGGGPALAGGVVGEETLWSCTTCSACVDVCPLGVRPLGFITDLRRYLIGEGKLRGAPAQALQKTGRNGNPWGLPARDRLAWAEGLDVPTIEENPDCELVYWVGCATAYDQRVQGVARALVRILKAAGVEFAVLGKSECCTGESARRMGDEFLFQELAEKNVAAFEKFGVRRGVKRVVATCPHCVNSLLQDYPDFGADIEVVHHTQLIAELIDTGRIALAPGAGEALLRGRGAGGAAGGGGGVAYHDPCYLARVQGVTEAPRKALRAGAGEQALVEMERHGRNTACCGAGGGRMWFDDGADTRVGRSRVDEVVASGAGTVAVSCPFCHSMVSDGIGAKDARVDVKDVAEIVADALES